MIITIIIVVTSIVIIIMMIVTIAIYIYIYSLMMIIQSVPSEGPWRRLAKNCLENGSMFSSSPSPGKMPWTLGGLVAHRLYLQTHGGWFSVENLWKSTGNVGKPVFFFPKRLWWRVATQIWGFTCMTYIGLDYLNLYLYLCIYLSLSLCIYIYIHTYTHSIHTYVVSLQALAGSWEASIIRSVMASWLIQLTLGD